jgi:hypothetical protein
MAWFSLKPDGKKRTAFLVLALLAGAVLRLSFPGDIEYKGDERYMFEAARRIARTGSWPSLGMVSGVGLRNPGMSVWVFGILEKITRASTPPELARAVQLLNLLGLLGLAFFSLRILPAPEREPWCWATAFAAVNPFAVLFQRKIWAQCTLPFFCVVLWTAWHYRRTKAGAFLWGLVGVCAGQVHLSGFFLAAGLFLGALIWDRRARWGAWLAGSLLGAVPLVPWLGYLAARPGGGFEWKDLLWLLYPKYWFYWATDSLGLGLVYFIKTRDFFDFLRYPLVGGRGTYLVAACHAVIIVGAALILVWAKRSGGWRGKRDSSDTWLALWSVLGAAGVLMTLTCTEVCRHYLIMTFPLEWVWLGRLGLRGGPGGRRCLAALWAAQLLISILFLVYLHVNHGDPSGNYGVAYQFQAP